MRLKLARHIFLVLAVVALMTAMMLSGPAAMAKHSNHGKHKGQPKVTLCFNGHTVKVGKPAAKVLMMRGATMGPCLMMM